MGIKNIVGLIGWPVSHSVSPGMQNRAFLELGCHDWLYVPMPVATSPNSRIKEAVLGLRALGIVGANVTVPHKEAVLPYLDDLSDMAKAIGAVNTIAIDNEGRLIGHNTDGLGFISDLVEHDVDPKGMQVVVLGAGGSARAITYALLSHGCQNITILNRTKSKANDIAFSFRDSFKNAIIKTDTLAAIKDTPSADLIINTTSIGLKSTGDQMPVDKDVHFTKSQIVYDLIYNPKMTTFLKHAAKDGARTINGLGMLVHQGALAFAIWTKQKAPVAAMKEAALAAL